MFKFDKQVEVLPSGLPAPEDQECAAPRSAGIKPRKRSLKRRVVPPPTDPGKVVDESKSAQVLNEVQLGRIKFIKSGVALEQNIEVIFLRLTTPG